MNTATINNDFLSDLCGREHLVWPRYQNSLNALLKAHAWHLRRFLDLRC